MSVNVAIEAQGNLLAVAVKYKVRPPGGGQRGKVTVFSAGSRRRLLQKTARLEIEKAVFITLTYPQRFPSGSDAKKHLRALFERLRRRYPKSSAMWRLEYQKRGAPHFHLIFFNLPFLPFKTLRTWWSEIISDYVDDDQPFVRIELIRSARGAMYYVSKYVAKVTDDGLFNILTYPHAGRWWGVFNKDYLPWATRQIIRITMSNYRRLDAVKLLMRSVWAGLPPDRGKGAVIYTDKSYLMLHQIVSEIIGGPGQ